MESVIISRKKLYFIFSAPTNIFNNIVISDEKYKYNKILNECIIGNQEGLKGEMYSILLFSDAYLTEDIKEPNITIKVTYNKEGNEEHVFLSNKILINPQRDNFSYFFKLNPEKSWLGMKKVDPPNSLNLSHEEQFNSYVKFMKNNNLIQNEILLSYFINDSINYFKNANLLLKIETFCFFDQFFIEQKFIKTQLHNDFLSKIVSDLINNKTLLFDFSMIFVQYLNSNGYIQWKYNIVNHMINNFAYIIEKDFFKYAFLLKEIEDNTQKFQNLISKFAIDKMKYPLKLPFEKYEEMVFKLFNNPTFLIPKLKGENAEMEVKKIYSLAFSLFKYCDINSFYPIIFTNVAQYEFIIETYQEYSKYLFDRNFIVQRVFPILNYNDIIKFLNGRKTLDNLKNIKLNRNRVCKICRQENKLIHIDEKDNNIIMQNFKAYKDLYNSLNKYQILSKYTFIEWGENIKLNLDNNKEIINNYPNKIENNIFFSNPNNENVYPLKNPFSNLQIKYLHEERFIKSFPEELLIDKSIMENNKNNINIDCEICLGILIYPISCSQCNRNFCKKCIGDYQEKSNKCPNCREIFKGINCNNNTIDYLNNIQLKCYHFKEGCNEIILYKNYIDHIKNCNFGEYKCPFNDCNSIVLKKDLDSHIQICGMIKIKCDLCMEPIPKIYLNEHINECGKSLVQCDLCFKNIESKEFRNHKKKCENKNLLCFNCFNIFTYKNYLLHNEFVCVKVLFKTFRRDFRIERGRRMNLESENLRLNSEINDLRRKINSYD